MTGRKKITRIGIIGMACLLMITISLQGQGKHLTDRTVSINLRRMPLAQLLDTIGRQGHFSFSYNSTILHGDSLVSVSFRDVSMRQALDQLLGNGYTYTEQGNYLIILQQPEGRTATESSYLLTGYIVDKNTGKGIFNASVYEQYQLQSVLTDEQGAFKLRLKARYSPAVLHVSKEWYTDTAIVVHPGYDQALKITITSIKIADLPPVFITSSKVERTWWGRFFLSSRQRIQGVNLTHFFTSRASQVSLLPSIGTHGRMDGQVKNDVSLNVIGGYSAGLKGVELAGAFNIDRQDVQGVQMAGVINLAGGDVCGVQGAGVLNYVSGSFSGVQLAGVVNKVKGNVTGVQAAYYANICKDTLRGLQLSGFRNKAGFVKGVQIGLINEADSSTGFSIGLISIVKHGGVHRLSISAAEVTGLNVAYIGGNQNLNSILFVSYNPLRTTQPFSYGFGLGKAFPPGGKWGMYTEATIASLYDTRTWKNLGLIARLQHDVTWQVNKKMSLFAGLAFSVYVAQAKLPSGLHPLDIAGKDLPSVSWGERTIAWPGACFGVRFF